MDEVFNICCECNKTWATNEPSFSLTHIFSNCKEHENKSKEFKTLAKRLHSKQEKV